MDQPGDTSFDDPALQAALRRTLGRETAPASLRDKLRVLAAQAQSAPAGADKAAENRHAVAGRIGPSTAQPPRKFTQTWYGRLAAAAVLVLGLGTLSYQLYQNYQAKNRYNSDKGIAQAVYDDMIAVHNRRAKDEAGPDTETDPATVGRNLSAHLGRGVFVPDLKGEGWALAGGAVRNVAGYPAAHLYYTKGSQAISVLSLPAGVAKGAPDGSDYQTTVAGVPIAGFTQGTGLFCVVGGTAVSMDEVKGILARHKGSIVKS